MLSSLEQSIVDTRFDEGAVLLIDKPVGWSSFDVVRKFQGLLKKKYGHKVKIGHAGTLDPLASGLLVICTGKKTKEIDQYINDSKIYSGTITVGATTPSFDLETEPENFVPIEAISNEKIYEIAKSFIGESMQMPPVYSAIKVDGKRAYKSARKGKELEMTKRAIVIYKFEITRIQLPEIDFIIECSKGTYIRSIAHDFGQKLECGAYLSSLCRESSGKFSRTQAIDPNHFSNLMLG
jgi:tRNA pseudouridine55 synthase